MHKFAAPHFAHPSVIAKHLLQIENLAARLIGNPSLDDNAQKDVSELLSALGIVETCLHDYGVRRQNAEAA